MKNEIELKEELLLLEAQYLDIANNSDNSKYTYWFNEPRKNKTLEIKSAIDSCKKELEKLNRLQHLSNQLDTLKTLRNTMKELIYDNNPLSESYICSYNKIESEILDIETNLFKNHSHEF